MSWDFRRKRLSRGVERTLRQPAPAKMLDCPKCGNRFRANNGQCWYCVTLQDSAGKNRIEAIRETIT